MSICKKGVRTGALFLFPHNFLSCSSKMPSRWLAGGLLFLYAFSGKRVIQMESNDFGDLLLMLLDDDLFPVEENKSCGENTTQIQEG